MLYEVITQGLTYKPTVRSDNYFLVKASTTNDATGLSTDSTKAVIIAPVLPSPSEIKQKSYSERHSPSQAQTIGNNLDRIVITSYSIHYTKLYE